MMIERVKERIRGWWNLRTGLIVVFRLALFVAGGSLVYLLFIFGHTDVTPMNTIVLTAAVAGTSALVAGILQWIGLPAGEPPNRKRAAKK